MSVAQASPGIWALPNAIDRGARKYLAQQQAPNIVPTVRDQPGSVEWAEVSRLRWNLSRDRGVQAWTGWIPQHDIAANLYREILDHHGIEIGRRHARKHLAAGIDVAGEIAGANEAEIKGWRHQVLTAEAPEQTLSLLQRAYDSFQTLFSSRSLGLAWKAAA